MDVATSFLVLPSDLWPRHGIVGILPLRLTEGHISLRLDCYRLPDRGGNLHAFHADDRLSESDLRLIGLSSWMALGGHRLLGAV